MGFNAPERTFGGWEDAKALQPLRKIAPLK
jgi:hypothetical protein